MRVLCVTLNHTDAWGGTTQCVSNFACALGADILSFTSELLLPTALQGEGITHIPVPNSLVGRLYSSPVACHLRHARELVRGYDFIVSHMLFHTHTNFVNRMRVPYLIVPHGSLDPYVLTYRR